MNKINIKQVNNVIQVKNWMRIDGKEIIIEKAMEQSRYVVWYYNVWRGAYVAGPVFVSKAKTVKGLRGSVSRKMKGVL